MSPRREPTNPAHSDRRRSAASSDVRGVPAGIVRRFLDAGLKPKTGRDQHFLHDPQLLEAMVRDAGTTASDVVFEVGTGAGTLTRVLAETAAEVISVEVDERTHEFARGELAAHKNVRLIRANVLESRDELAPDVAALLRRAEGFLWVSNLPYSIASPLIVAVLAGGFSWRRALLLVQAEVADRLCAEPGTRQYGPLTALRAFWASARRVRTVSRRAFWPPPQVDSASILLEPRGDATKLTDYGSYAWWVKTLFGQRRKQLGGLLRRQLGDVRALRALELVGVSAQQRPEELSSAAFARLAEEFPVDGI